MKSLTLVAVIAVILDLLVSVYFALGSYELIDYNREVIRIAQSLSVLSGTGLLIFFIALFQKQSK